MECRTKLCKTPPHLHRVYKRWHSACLSKVTFLCCIIFLQPFKGRKKSRAQLPVWRGWGSPLQCSLSWSLCLLLLQRLWPWPDSQLLQLPKHVCGDNKCYLKSCLVTKHKARWSRITRGFIWEETLLLGGWRSVPPSVLFISNTNST